MAKLLSIIIGITLLFDLSNGEISKWKEYLSKQKILSTRSGGRIVGNEWNLEMCLLRI
jgi:transcriptional antiterminator